MFCNDPPNLYPNSILDSCYMNGICSIDETRNSYLRLQRQSTIFDPIRDWVEKEVKRINEKYAWAEAL